MAVNKLDITMMEDVGTSANQLVQRDGSGNLPAVDGSQLIDVDPGFTVSTSDPVIATNPSGGVGSLWYNKTDGEMYVCTDATAGANVWINVGGGTGDIQLVTFPAGVTYGFFAGGNGTINTIDKYAFASNTTAADHGDLYLAKVAGTGSCSETYGYSAGSSTPGPYGNAIDKFAFASNTTGTDVGNLIVGTREPGGNQQTTSAVYWSAGLISSGRTTKVNKCLTASDGDATDVGDVTQAVYELSGCCETDYAYSYGGEGPYGGSSMAQGKTVSKFTFASAGTAADHGDLVQESRSGYGAMSETYGYQMGGTDSTNYHDSIQKFAFASNTTGTDVSNLSYAFGGGTAASQADTNAYRAGGWGGTWNSYANVNSIDKFVFSTGTNTVDHGDLQAAKSNSLGSLQV